MKVVNYIVVEAQSGKLLEERVKERLYDGFRLYGDLSVSLCENGDFLYVQPMILLECDIEP